MKPIKATVLSNAMYSVLKEAIRENGITLERMLQLKQTTAGPVVRRGYLKWFHHRKRFMPTQLAMAVKAAFDHTSVNRVDTTRPLSQFIYRNVLDKRGQELAEAQRMQNKQEAA